MWVIWANSKTWSAEGYIPDMITDMYSGLAKAYGIHTVLSFLSQTTLYPVIFSHPHTVHLHCDNNGMIEWIQNTPSTLHSQVAIHDNYPILAKIKHQLQAMPMIQVSFHHVKATKKRGWLTAN